MIFHDIKYGYVFEKLEATETENNLMNQKIKFKSSNSLFNDFCDTYYTLKRPSRKNLDNIKLMLN